MVAAAVDNLSHDRLLGSTASLWFLEVDYLWPWRLYLAIREKPMIPTVLWYILFLKFTTLVATVPDLAQGSWI